MKLILTCEHGGNKIPPKYIPLFKTAGEVLDSHRGYDPGALQLFQELRDLASFEKHHTISRLLVELNRSLHHPQLFSEFTNPLPSEEKREILEQFYFPYRNEVEEQIKNFNAAGESVLHLSIHSFTPQLHGKVRNADVGLLYDPSRKGEKELAEKLKKLLLQQDPSLKVRFNYPYLGKADGFTTYLRKKFRRNYAGLEIEVNQKHFKKSLLNKDLKNNFYKAVSDLLK